MTVAFHRRAFADSARIQAVFIGGRAVEQVLDGGGSPCSAIGKCEANALLRILLAEIQHLLFRRSCPNRF